MSNPQFDGLLVEVVDTVLETMFFSASIGPAEAESGDAVLEARLAFHGSLSGTLSVRISDASARALAAGFLGQDEEALTSAQPGQVVCELANMLCGSLVSKMEGEERFDLDSPELLSQRIEDAASQQASAAGCQSFQLENGVLTVTLHLGITADA
jgi:CheY-specific phosphatase CheX